MRSSKWYVKFPSEFHALGPIRFNHAVNEREARREARLIFLSVGCRRLPRGTEVYPA